MGRNFMGRNFGDLRIMGRNSWNFDGPHSNSTVLSPNMGRNSWVGIFVALESWVGFYTKVEYFSFPECWEMEQLTGLLTANGEESIWGA